MDPFTIGLLSMAAAQNPEQFGPMLTQLGLPVPKLGEGGTAPQTPAATPIGPSAANAGLQGIKAPAAIQPIMSGGVAGGVKPPELTAKMGQGSPAIQSLMAALLSGRGGEMPVPTLGSYIRGGKY